MTDQLRLNLGRRLRDEGMARALDAEPTVKEMAAQAIENLAKTGRPFNADDVREFLTDCGIVVTHPNALGGVFAAAARRGQIRRDGYRQTTSATQHAHTHPLWIGT